MPKTKVVPYVQAVVPFGMAFNLKDEKALSELRRISDMTGSSMSKELSIAIHQRLVVVASERDEKLERLRAISRRSSRLWTAKSDPIAALYDDVGLPK